MKRIRRIDVYSDVFVVEVCLGSDVHTECCTLLEESGNETTGWFKMWLGILRVLLMESRFFKLLYLVRSLCGEFSVVVQWLGLWTFINVVWIPSLAIPQAMLLGHKKPNSGIYLVVNHNTFSLFYGGFSYSTIDKVFICHRIHFLSGMVLTI